MGIKRLADHTLLVELSLERQIRDEIESVTEIIYNCGDCDVIMDFSSVNIITSTSISGLLTLRKLLTDRGRRLVFCNVAALTKGIFKVTGLDEIFEFADDKSAALEDLQPSVKCQFVNEWDI